MRLLEQGGIFILPLLICSVVMVAIIAERCYVFATVMKTSLISYGNPDEMVKKLRCRLISLHTIIAISPMLGLIGTIAGLMKCFHLLGSQEAGFDPKIMSMGIYEALITTATGLAIAVIATIFYNYFSSTLESYVFDFNIAVKGKTENG
jgi:biopolymer transport protein ExbB